MSIKRYTLFVVKFNSGGHFLSNALNNGEIYIYDGLRRAFHTASKRRMRPKAMHLIQVYFRYDIIMWLFHFKFTWVS